MNKPSPNPIAPERLVELAQQVMREARFPDLATLDGNQPRVRPVSPVKIDGFAVYVANLRSYHKTAEIAANPRVELCYLDAGHNQVRITGVAEVLSDRVELEAIWLANPLLRQYLGSIDNPELIVYRIVPKRGKCATCRSGHWSTTKCQSPRTSRSAYLSLVVENIPATSETPLSPRSHSLSDESAVELRFPVAPHAPGFPNSAGSEVLPPIISSRGRAANHSSTGKPRAGGTSTGPVNKMTPIRRIGTGHESVRRRSAVGNRLSNAD